MDKADSVLSMIGERMSSSTRDDEFDLLGKTVAVKLRNLSSNKMQMVAEKLIHEVLYEAQLGTLTEHTKLTKEVVGQQPQFPNYQVLPYTVSELQANTAMSSQQSYCTYQGVPPSNMSQLSGDQSLNAVLQS